MSSPRRGPRKSVLVFGAGLVAMLCWWLWPEDERSPPGLSAVGRTAATTPPPQRAAPQEEPRRQPSRAPARVQAPRPSQPSAAKDPLVDARRKLLQLRKGRGGEELRRHLGTLALHPDLDRAERVLLIGEADALNARLVWSATPGPAFGSVKVEPNDSYWKIARRVTRQRGVAVTAGMLEAINKVRPQRLRLGQSLKVPNEAVSLLADKSAFSLYVLLGGVYVRHFSIGIGEGSSTPEGTFTVSGKTAKPVWTDPKTGKRYKYGEEGHLIGSRWMGFWRDGGPTGYGIHGTISPESIGKAVSDGCIRLLNSDVEALFELVPEGSTVLVRP